MADIIELKKKPGPAATKEPIQPEEEEKVPQAEILIQIAEANAELFLNDSKEATASYFVNSDQRITQPVGFTPRSSFGIYLAHEYRKENKRAAGSEAISRALLALQGIAAYSGRVVALENRIAFHQNAVWYDLGAGYAVRVDSSGWKIVNGSAVPILFKGQQHQERQLHPVGGGDYKKLFHHFRVKVEDQALMLAWLVAAFIPSIPRPILGLSGEKGSGKTSQVRKLRKLIDPSITETLRLSNDAGELVAILDHHYMCNFDNLDGLRAWQSDALCRACTGEGNEKRQLFTDDQAIIRRFRRVIVFNGINCAAARADLLDRCVMFELQRIDPASRRAEEDLWAEFEAERPELLGAIFDLLSKAMKLKPAIKLKELPRMADFAIWGAAIATAAAGEQGAVDFMQAYRRNIDSANSEVISGTPIAAAIIKIAADIMPVMSGEKVVYRKIFTAGELLKELNFIAADIGVDDVRHHPGWPKAPNSLTRKLRGILSNLRDAGVLVTIGEHGEVGRMITIERVNKEPKTSSEPSGPSEPF